MRELKFRARDIKTGEWVYGYVEIFVQGIGKPTAIIHQFSDWNLNLPSEVDVDNVGQYIGLEDKNGKEIYEGDIVKVNISIIEDIGVVAWDEIFMGFVVKCGIHNETFMEIDSTEVVGNTYENPNLLETEK